MHRIVGNNGSFQVLCVFGVLEVVNGEVSPLGLEVVVNTFRCLFRKEAQGHLSVFCRSAYFILYNSI
jgi:hypothetical protein